MVSLPQSIENALKEAGFSPTEILILNHLLEQQGMTLRELAAKTGKSTGVLDQAMKKLLRRRIVERQTINDTPKYVVTSMQSIVDWMEEDTRQRREEIDRRYHNFESFILTLERERSRPQVEHFEGLDGIQRAYSKLLECGGKDIVGYVPLLFKEENDPLREFKVQWFRERYNKGAFLRIITHEGPMGRRFQNRDAFEYRKSLLVNPEQHPISLEKYIASDMMATIDYNKRSAMLLYYPELARSERAMFEHLWKAKTENLPLREIDAPLAPKPMQSSDVDQGIGMRTKFFSLVREFFVGPKSWIAIGFCAVIAGSLSFTIHTTTARINTERIRERVTAIASTATVEFRPEELRQLHTMKDVETATYRTVVERLKQIRRRNPDIMYVYLLRPLQAGTMSEFIADADAEHPSKVSDTNKDGRITPADDLGFPGVQYDGSYIDVLSNHEYEVPVATREPYTDKWGTFFTGYAPIRDAAGTLVALVAVDMTGQDLLRYNQETYRPLIGFGILFIIFILLRFASQNSAFFSRAPMLQSLLRGKRWLLAGVFLLLLLCLTLLQWQKHLVLRRYGERAMAIASTAAVQIDARDLNVLRKAGDMKRPEYQRVFQQINEIRNQNPGVTYVDIFRKTTIDGMWQFVVDADANYDIYYVTDTNADGLLNGQDVNPWPGMMYDAKGYGAEIEGKSFNDVYTDITTDQWGTYLAGSAPIRDNSGAIVAELAINFDVPQILRKELGAMFFALLQPISLRTVLGSLIIFLSVLFVRFVYVYRSILRSMVPVPTSRHTVVVVCVGVVCIVIALFTLRHIRQQAHIRAVGEKAQAIAATAALFIDANDLVPLRKAEDIKRPEYQRVYDILNDVRDQNPDILYIYIFRPTQEDGIWEFVVDADSNFNVPVYTDVNSDGVLDDRDAAVWPGFAYDVETIFPQMAQDGLRKPIYGLNMVDDQWGNFITGSAPIYNNKGVPVAVLGVDYDYKKTVKF